ncbi:MAG: helix-turn-helix domain-containing protein [Actinomycetia bacterium]|nr:helix-turn-helix domain-containing protein [Actinomycetes bacterium]
MKNRYHPLASAIEPLLDALGATVVDLDQVTDADITLYWDDEPAVGVRLAGIVSLERLVVTVEGQLGSPLADLDRAGKQQAIRMLDERGAFLLRKSIEDIAEAMGVSRITIYNYLNATKANANAPHTAKGAG